LASKRKRRRTAKVSFFIPPPHSAFPYSLYDFIAVQFRKQIWAIVILMNFPVLEGFKSFHVLTIHTQTKYIELFFEDDLEAHLESDQNDNDLQ